MLFVVYFEGLPPRHLGAVRPCGTSALHNDAFAMGLMTGAPAGFSEDGPDSPAAMEHAFKWIVKYGGGLAFILIIAWPCLALPAGVFSKGEREILLLPHAKPCCGPVRASCVSTMLCPITVQPARCLLLSSQQGGRTTPHCCLEILPM